MNRLKYYRERANLSQGGLAEKTGIEQSIISRVETGIRDLSGQRWKIIAKALGCTVDELLGERRE